jgi:hypothetical protein
VAEETAADEAVAEETAADEVLRHIVDRYDVGSDDWRRHHIDVPDRVIG